MKTLILTAMLALTAVSTVLAASGAAEAGPCPRLGPVQTWTGPHGVQMSCLLK
jgi:hypothetical protein